MQEIPISKLRARPENLRDDADGSDLVESLRSLGVLQPLNVTKDGDKDVYWVNAGHRRLDGAKKAGLKTVPCIVVELDESEVIATMIAENGQRRDLSIFEEARGFQALVDLGKSQADIAALVGVSRPVVSKRIKLAALPAEIVAALPDDVSADRAEKLADAHLAGATVDELLGVIHVNTWAIDRLIEEAKFRGLENKLRAKLANLDVPLISSNDKVIVDSETGEITPVEVEWVTVTDDDGYESDEPNVIGTGPLDIEAAMARDEVVGLAVVKVDGKAKLATVVTREAPDYEKHSVDEETGEVVVSYDHSKKTKSDEEKLEARKQRERARAYSEFLVTVAQGKIPADLLTEATFRMVTGSVSYSTAKQPCELLGIEPHLSGGKPVVKDYFTPWREAVDAADTPSAQKRLMWAALICNWQAGLEEPIKERFGWVEPV